MIELFFVCLCFSADVVIIPRPNKISVLSGEWKLADSASIGYDPSAPGAQEIAGLAASQLRSVTGYSLPVVTSVPSSGIYFRLSTALKQTGEYSITMTASSVEISGANRTAFFYGFQTLLQLLPNAVLYGTHLPDVSWIAPIVSIRDWPRFPWRGIMVDVCRHFHPISTLKSLIEGMARYKLSVLHIHLTDDQGWRIESKKYPLLTSVGSVRDSSPVRWNRTQKDHIPYGPYFYTQDQMRELIQFAHKYEVEIVPEFEMPGHSLAALSAYPQYSCAGGPFTPLDYWGGVPDVFCPGNNGTLTFLQDLLDEMMTIFDSPFIHVGGDECSHKRWETCPKCQARMKAFGLKSTDELQSWFINQMAHYLTSKGRRLIGWDEILDGGLPDETAVMSWRGTEGGIEAADEGHEVVMTPGSNLYLDHYQFPGDDGYEYISGLCALHTIYKYNPTDGISQEFQKFIIGCQGNLWSEYVWGKDDLEWKLFPRSAAVAEIGWSEDKEKNWNRFLTGLSTVELKRLEILGRNVAGLASGLSVHWSPADIPTKWITMQWHVTGALGAAMEYQIAFIHNRGKNALKINNVKLYINGQLAGTDNHDGTAFNPPQDNIYSIKTSTAAGTSKAYITANVTCVNGTDSGGNIYVYAV